MRNFAIGVPPEPAKQRRSLIHRHANACHRSATGASKTQSKSYIDMPNFAIGVPPELSNTDKVSHRYANLCHRSATGAFKTQVKSQIGVQTFAKGVPREPVQHRQSLT